MQRINQDDWCAAASPPRPPPWTQDVGEPNRCNAWHRAEYSTRRFEILRRAGGERFPCLVAVSKPECDVRLHACLSLSLPAPSITRCQSATVCSSAPVCARRPAHQHRARHTLSAACLSRISSAPRPLLPPCPVFVFPFFSSRRLACYSYLTSASLPASISSLSHSHPPIHSPLLHMSPAGPDTASLNHTPLLTMRSPRLV